MENRELINGILDLTAENERLKLELANVKEPIEYTPNQRKGITEQELIEKRIYAVLKNIAIREFFYSWKLEDSLAGYNTIYDKEDKPIRYELYIPTFDKWFNKIDIDYICEKNTVLASCGIIELKNFLKEELKIYFDKNQPNCIEKVKEEVEEKNLKLQEKKAGGK